jgi:hypothetical protein
LEAQRELFNFEALKGAAVFPHILILLIFLKIDRTAIPAQCNALQTTSWCAPVSTRLAAFNITANDKLSLLHLYRRFFHARVSR